MILTGPQVRALAGLFREHDATEAVIAEVGPNVWVSLYVEDDAGPRAQATVSSGGFIRDFPTEVAA